MNKKALATAIAVAVTGGVIAYFSTRSTTQPGLISIHAPCTQTLYPANAPIAYTGNFALLGWETGLMVINPITNSQQFINGVWYAHTGACTGQAAIQWTINDCFQSVIHVTASNGTPKWVIGIGSPDGCGNATHPVPPNGTGMDGVMVWAFSGTQLQVKGLISTPQGLRVEIHTDAILDHDTAWVKLTQNKGWVPCDLNGGTCGWNTPQPSPPSGEGRQSGVGGVTYNVGIDYAHPNENGGPVWFWMLPSDQPTPTRPPNPTSTRTVTGSLSRTPTKTPTLSPPDDCILTGVTCTPTPSVRTRTPSPTRTSVPIASATPTATPPRFQVAVTWTKPDGTSGTGSPSCVESSPGQQSTDYWFFSPGNRELMLTIAPSYCSQSPYVMVKLGGTTNVQVDIDITDHQTGKTYHYESPQGQTFLTQINASVLPCGN